MSSTLVLKKILPKRTEVALSLLLLHDSRLLLAAILLRLLDVGANTIYRGVKTNWKEE